MIQSQAQQPLPLAIQVQWQWLCLCYAEGTKGRKGKRATPGIPQKVVTIHSKINHRAWKDKGCKKMIPSQAGYGAGNGEEEKKNKRSSDL